MLNAIWLQPKWRIKMKKMQIFEPAMCCPTGVCGVGVDPELLRISTILNTLKKSGIEVDRFNLSGSPQEFISNKIINKYINEKGVEGLPVTVVDREIVIEGRYPTNEEIVKLLGVSVGSLGAQPKVAKVRMGRSEDGCKGQTEIAVKKSKEI
jgi:hypothetical protein